MATVTINEMKDIGQNSTSIAAVKVVSITERWSFHRGRVNQYPLASNNWV